MLLSSTATGARHVRYHQVVLTGNLTRDIQKFRTRVRWRNIREWAACAVLAWWWTRDALATGTRAVLCATAVSLAALAYVALYMFREGQCRLVSQHDDGMSERFAAELRRHAALLERVPRWYLGPLVIALVAQLAARMIGAPRDWRLAATLMAGLVATIMPVGAAVVWLNRRAARELRTAADRLALGAAG
jgi:hypothetical protein